MKSCIKLSPGDRTEGIVFSNCLIFYNPGFWINSFTMNALFVNCEFKLEWHDYIERLFSKNIFVGCTIRIVEDDIDRVWDGCFSNNTFIDTIIISREDGNIERRRIEFHEGYWFDKFGSKLHDFPLV